MLTEITKQLCIIFMGMGFWLPAVGLADRIIMIDGAVEESEHVWETENHVHFILKGTQSVEIRFAKEIVARIESDNNIARAPKKTTIITDPHLELKKPREKKDPHHYKPLLTSNQPQLDKIRIHEQLAKANKGVSFYDPRRTRRYCLEKNICYSNLGEALDALAQQYEHTVAWVESNMGNENDLGAIHTSLSRRWHHELVDPDLLSNSLADPILEPSTSKTTGQAESTIQNRVASPQSQAGFKIKFYDPRRPEKYWVGPNERYATMDAAINALAEQYDTTTQWVESHMGDSNELSQIHDNLKSSLHP